MRIWQDSKQDISSKSVTDLKYRENQTLLIQQWVSCPQTDEIKAETLSFSAENLNSPGVLTSGQGEVNKTTEAHLRVKTKHTTSSWWSLQGFSWGSFRSGWSEQRRPAGRLISVSPERRAEGRGRAQTPHPLQLHNSSWCHLMTNSVWIQRTSYPAVVLKLKIQRSIKIPIYCLVRVKI